MHRRNLSSLALSVVLAAGMSVGVGLVGGSSALGQVGTSVTYQGQLKNNGVAVNSPADVCFSIWDAASAGTQIGTTDTKTAVPVSQGLFSTTFDCGVNPYTADAARWLQIEVRNPSNVGGFVLLGSRQRLTPAPFSAATRGINVPANGEVHALGNFRVPAGGAIFTHNNVNNNGGRLHIQSGNDGTFDGLYLNPFPNGGNVYLGNGAGAANLICYDRVGIGTGAPDNKLHVESPNSPSIGLSRPGGEWFEIGIATANGQFSQSALNNDAIIRTRNDARLHLQTGTGPAALTIASDDSIGIGTNSPSHKLTVVDPGNGNTQRFIGPLGSFQWGARLFWGDSDFVRISEPSDDTMLLWAINGVQCGQTFSAPAKNFRIDHPSDPANMILNHGCIESDQYVNLYRGNTVIGNDGGVWIQLPAWMNDLNTDFSYQLTSVGAAQPNLFVAVEVNQNNQFRVAGGQPGAKVSWQITGVRHDAYVQSNPLVVEEVKQAKDRGTYLSPNSFGIYTAEELAKMGNRK